MANVREYLDWDDAYFKINHEERNVAAILYHILLSEWPVNLNRFLQSISCNSPVLSGEVGIYFEYSCLRDLWAQINGTDSNRTKRELIYSCLNPCNRDELNNMSTLEFNTFFGAVPKASHKFIQSPGNWSIGRFKENISDKCEFLKVCKFKWSFKAKPDIVIHTSHDTAVCIEAKFMSDEGHYPTTPSEIREFKRRELPFVSQTSLQEYMMVELLGIETQFVFLVQKPSLKPKTHNILLWKDAFACLNTENCPPFVKKWIELFS